MPLANQELYDICEPSPMTPNILLVPPSLEAVTRRILTDKYIRSIGNYYLVEHEDGSRDWNRDRDSIYYCGDRFFPRMTGYYETFYYPTRSMRKHGFPSIMNEQQWSKHFAVS